MLGVSLFFYVMPGVTKKLARIEGATTTRHNNKQQRFANNQHSQKYTALRKNKQAKQQLLLNTI